MGQPLGAALIARVIAAGTVFRLKSGGSGWILTQLYTFDDNATGYSPNEPVTIGPDGTLYGSAKGGRCAIPMSAA